MSQEFLNIFLVVSMSFSMISLVTSMIMRIVEMNKAKSFESGKVMKIPTPDMVEISDKVSSIGNVSVKSSEEIHAIKEAVKLLIVVESDKISEKKLAEIMKKLED